MSNFLNKIPVSPITSFGNPSVPNGSTIGTNFSILQTGGFMEVYTLSGLTYTIPPATTGIIEFSGNSIPIQFTKGSGSVFSPDVLTLNSDNISSGRRKLGMLAYVYETNKIYQFRIDNYDTLWNSATGATGPGGPTVVISDFGTTVKNNSVAGIAFINAWTASTISGVGGYDDTNASWRVLQTGGGTFTGGTVTGATNFTNGLTANTISATTYQNLPTDIRVTGGTYSDGTTTFTNNTGGTFTVSGYFTGQTDNSITGGTFNNNTDTLTLNNSTGGTVTITGFTDYYTTGFTFNPANYDLTIQRNDGLPDLSVNLSILSSDVTITGGTYNSSTGTATFTNNTGGTFNVTGFLTGFTDIYVTGGTFNNNNQTLTLTRSDNVNVNVSGFTDVFVTGGTYSGSTIIFRNNSGGTFNVTGITTSSTFTGGTVTGATSFTGGLTANTISATTYQNLPSTPFLPLSGGTVTGQVIIKSDSNPLIITTDNYSPGSSGNILYFTDITGSTNGKAINSRSNGGGSGGDLILQQGGNGSVGVNKLVGSSLNYNLDVNGSFGATSVSATTYFNLPTDIRVTGGTYSGSTIIFRNNSGGTFNVTGITTSSAFTGGTVTGATIFTGGLTANTISATTYQNLPQDIFVTGGTYTSGNAIFTNNSGGTFTVSGFPIGSGGGQIFYLNLSQSQNGNRLLSTTGSTASEQSTGVTINNGVTGTISSFQSQPLNTTLLPGGIWSFYLHSYKQNNNASFNIFVEVYKITSGGTQTLLFTTDPTPVTTNSPNPSMQLTDGYFSGTSLSVTDGVVAVVKATNTSNQSHTITFFTEGSQHYSYVVSTIPTQQGLTCNTLSGCSIIQTIQTDVSNKLDKSGGTITGNLIINSGLTANTISATTYQNLPATPFLPLSGGTVTGETIFTGGLTANTISATTYQNLPPSLVKSINSVSGNTNAGSNQSTDYIYFASNTITITLPTAISNTNSYVIKNVGTGTITINTTSSQTIDGSLTALIKVEYLSLTLISDGANWNII